MRHPKLNIYRCGNGHSTVTVDVAEGTTPFMIGCMVPGCMADAQSGFYPKFPPPMVAPVPTHEWYAPSKKETKRLRPGEKQHVEMGGLLLRPRTQMEPIYEELDG